MALRTAALAGIVIAVIVAACGGGGDSADPSPQQEVTINFTTDATENDIDVVRDVLRTHGDLLEYLVMESFPVVGRAFLRSNSIEFCREVVTALEVRDLPP